MKLGTASAYCDLSASAFLGEVAAARLPAPVLLGKRDHWDRLALDAALNAIAGHEGEPDYRRKLRGRYGQAA